MKTIAIIGTGTLGPSIAQVFAQCESIKKVYLCKGRPESKRTGKDDIERSYTKLVSKGKISSEKAELILNKIETGGMNLARNADLVVEAVSEDINIKSAVFSELDRMCDAKTIFATNTSSLSVSKIGEGISRPIIGMHFFNPATIMQLVEVVVSDSVPDEIVNKVIELVHEIGKVPVRVMEAPGFVVNRILIPMINEAIAIYAEGVATAEDIDTAMKLGANHPMGPLALCDLIGLDVVLAIMNTLQKETGDTKYMPQPLLKKMVREKKLGRKTGEGFYSY